MNRPKQSHQSSAAETLCANCGQRVEATYCSHCGEKVLSAHDRSLWHVLSESFELLFHFDSKFFRTVGLLIAKPGFLTTEYWAGRRVTYMKPFQFLILLNLFYFISGYLSARLGFGVRVMFPALSDITGDRFFSGWASHAVQAELAARNISLQSYAESFDVHLEQLAKSLVILLVPILAVFLKMFYWRTKKFFLDHLIAATHLVGFYILFWSLFMLFMGCLIKVSSFFVPDGSFVQNIWWIVHYIPAVIICLYIFLATRRMYKQSVILTMISALLFIFVVIQAITNIYDFILFWAAFYLM